MYKFIITGATGYIGSHICRKLIECGYKVSIISRKTSDYSYIDDIKWNIEIFEYDGKIENLVRFFRHQEKNSMVIHLASMFISENKPKDIDMLIDSNIKFSTHILEAMKYSDCKKIINTSTSWQHYNNEKYNPVCLYAATKQAFEDILKFYINSYNIQSITLELFDTYGENDNRSKILNILDEYSEKEKVLDMSEGDQILDLLYIEDVVEAYLIAIDILKNNNDICRKKYSLQSKNRIKLRNLVNLYQKITGKHVNINWGSRPYREREVMIPWSKGEVLPNWEPKYTLEEGLKKAFLK